MLTLRGLTDPTHATTPEPQDSRVVCCRQHAVQAFYAAIRSSADISEDRGLGGTQYGAAALSQRVRMIHATDKLPTDSGSC